MKTVTNGAIVPTWLRRPVTDTDIAAYLTEHSDFDLELFVYRSLNGRGWLADHGGSYLDPRQKKLRQFDVRAAASFDVRQRVSFDREVYLTVECKSLSPEAPLVILRVPAPEEETVHSVIKRWHRPEAGDTAFQIVPIGHLDGARMYRPLEMAGKSAPQVTWDRGGHELTGSDGDVHEKWSQALASAGEVIDIVALLPLSRGVPPAYTFVMPVLVIPNGTLRVVDYDAAGHRSAPRAVDEAILWVNRGHTVKNEKCSGIYHLSYLHVYTRTGFIGLLDDFAVGPTSRMVRRMFDTIVTRDFK
jgi:hypothetical protein